MNKFIEPNPNVHIQASALIESLRSVIRSLVKLHYEVESTKVSQHVGGINLYAWLCALSFFTRKIHCLYLGASDLDYEFSDIDFSYIRRGGALK
jgi:hypothetical protein